MFCEKTVDQEIRPKLWLADDNCQALGVCKRYAKFVKSIVMTVGQNGQRGIFRCWNCNYSLITHAVLVIWPLPFVSLRLLFVVIRVCPSLCKRLSYVK